MTRLFAVILIVVVSIAATGYSHAASIIKVNYSQKGDSVARMVYTGPDGGSSSDGAIYWNLLGKAPERAYEVKIKPDRSGGKTATLSGEVAVSIQIRNKINMGTAKTDKLTLVRDDAESTKWYLPANELKRLKAIIDKKSAKMEPSLEQGSSARPSSPNHIYYFHVYSTLYDINVPARDYGESENRRLKKNQCLATFTVSPDISFYINLPNHYEPSIRIDGLITDEGDSFGGTVQIQVEGVDVAYFHEQTTPIPLDRLVQMGEEPFHFAISKEQDPYALDDSLE